MGRTDTQTSQRDRQEQQDRNAELERRVKAEGLDLDHPEGKERFEELLRKAAKPVK
jgi:crotonobetainyl-CoA:carnitine CoA-transferase CaiB-like acyl-CoA transferase